MNCCDYNCNQGRDCPARMECTEEAKRQHHQPTPPDNSLYTLMQDITYWACVMVVTVCIVVSVVGVASYIFHRWF